MKKTCKIIILTFLVITMYANTFNVEAKEIWNLSKNFLNDGGSGIHGNGVDSGYTYDGFIEILDFLYGFGILVIAVSTIILGIRYMMVSPNEKSRIKQATTPYIIGVVIIFGAVTIWRLIIEIIDGSIG